MFIVTYILSEILLFTALYVLNKHFLVPQTHKEYTVNTQAIHSKLMSLRLEKLRNSPHCGSEARIFYILIIAYYPGAVTLTLSSPLVQI